MTASHVGHVKQDRVAKITLNRLGARNAIDPVMEARLREIWVGFNDVDVVILTGAGTAFCAVGDRTTWFAQWAESDAAMVRRNAKGVRFGALTGGLNISEPMIGAINGSAPGASPELALACDIRIASDKTMFGVPLVAFGFHRCDGGISRQVDTCGIAVARVLELSSEPIDAQQALGRILVTRVVAHDEPMTSAHTLAKLVAQHHQWAVRSAKPTVLDVIGYRLDDQLECEALAAYAIDRASVRRIRESIPLRGTGDVRHTEATS